MISKSKVNETTSNYYKCKSKELEESRMKKKKFSPHGLAKRGITPLEQMQIRKLAHEKDKQIEKEVFKKMMVIPLMALRENHWQKGSKQKFKQFFEEMLTLYEEFGEGGYTMEEAKKYIKECCGIEFDELVK